MPPNTLHHSSVHWSNVSLLFCHLVSTSKLYERNSLNPFLPTAKFHMGEDFYCLARVAQDYVELFPPPDRKMLLLSLIEGEANDLVRDEGVLDSPITPETFQQLQDCLTDRLQEAELVQQFQTRV
ncbi:unnamed protein product [Echinostoma caproni]|uniref:Uncharacterized protein n=1 Tax=Echinostoma caproni TaxID=27848 RepID=A0A183B835_9TREM|nr:unnamed protein product [Echinostoma caproni]